MSISSFKDFISNNGYPFSTQTTGVDSYDDIISNAEYFKESKGLTYEIVEMSPSEFLEEIKTNKKIYGKQTNWKDQERIDEFKSLMESGEKCHLPVLKFVYDKSNKLVEFIEEGKQRAVAAEELGINIIPVMKINQRLKYEF